MSDLTARMYLTDPREGRLPIVTRRNSVDESIWSMWIGDLELVAIDPTGNHDTLSRGVIRILDEMIDGLSMVRAELMESQLEADELSSAARFSTVFQAMLEADEPRGEAQ